MAHPQCVGEVAITVGKRDVQLHVFSDDKAAIDGWFYEMDETAGKETGSLDVRLHVAPVEAERFRQWADHWPTALAHLARTVIGTLGGVRT